MNKLSIATISAALMMGIAGAVPATAGTLTFEYEAHVSGNATVTPFAASLAEFYLENYLDLPDVTIPLNPSFSEVFEGTFTTLDDPAQFLDGDITLNAPVLSSLFGITVPDITQYPELAQLTQSLLVSFTGTGSLTSGTGTTNFNFNYVNATQSIVINGFDTNVVNGCLVGVCTSTGLGNLAVSTTYFGFPLPVMSGQGQFTLNTTPVPQSVVPISAVLSSESVSSTGVPEPSAVLSLIAVGGFLVAKRKMHKAA